MSVVWIVENPAAGTARITNLLCGFIAVRAFATVRSMLRVALCEPHSAGITPSIVLLEDHCTAGSRSLEKVVAEVRGVLTRNGWDGVQIVMVDSRDGASGTEDPGISRHVKIGNLVDCIRQLTSYASNSTLTGSRQLQEGDLRLDLDAGKVTCLACGQHDTLSPTETRLLRLLLENRDRVVTRSEVIGKVWNGTKIATRSLDAHISRLRKRIGFTGILLESAYGDGYRLSTGSGCEAASGRITASRGGSTGISRTAARAKANAWPR